MTEKRICCTIRGTLKSLFEKECENLALKESELIRLSLNNYLRDKGTTQGATKGNSQANK